MSILDDINGFFKPSTPPVAQTQADGIAQLAKQQMLAKMLMQPQQDTSTNQPNNSPYYQASKTSPLQAASDAVNKGLQMYQMNKLANQLNQPGQAPATPNAATDNAPAFSRTATPFNPTNPWYFDPSKFGMGVSNG